MTEVRGRALKSVQKFVKKQFGQAGLDKWLDTISAEAYTIYGSTIDINEWFPLRTALIEPMANVAQLFFSWDINKACIELGRYSADSGLAGPYKFLAKLGPANYFLEKAGETFAEYYRPGKMELIQSDDNNAILRITEFGDADKTVELRVLGWLQRALEINSRKEIKVDITKSLTNHDNYTEFVISWQ